MLVWCTARHGHLEINQKQASTGVHLPRHPSIAQYGPKPLAIGDDIPLCPPLWTYFPGALGNMTHRNSREALCRLLHASSAVLPTLKYHDGQVLDPLNHFNGLLGRSLHLYIVPCAII